VTRAIITFLVFLVLPAHADEAFPSRPVKIVVPFPAGGTADVLPRILAEGLREKWKQPVVVENRPGAGGNIGAEQVARAAPDGTTLLASPPGPLAINHHLFRQLGYDPTRFVPITIVGAVPNTLAVSTKVDAGSVQELIAVAKRAPTPLNYASQGIGSTSHLTTEMFKSLTGVQLTHVPYKGTADALIDLIGGHVDLMFDNLGSALPQHRAGKIRILAVAGETRAPTAPELPTMAESGLPGFRSIAWFGLVAPPETPAPIAASVQAAVAEQLQRPEVRTRFLEYGAEPMGYAPAATARFIAEESARWQQVIAAAKVTLN
jgi:tripartite-type tricarboxylate transporter receptor subunit TctC